MLFPRWISVCKKVLPWSGGGLAPGLYGRGGTTLSMTYGTVKSGKYHQQRAYEHELNVFS